MRLPLREGAWGGLSLTRSRFVGLSIALYIAVVLTASLVLHIALSVDRMVILLAIIGLSTGRARQFLKDWTVFLIVLLAWQFMSSMSRHFGHLKPHVTEMIDFDRFLFFGHVPTIWLQRHLYHPGHIQWYDRMSAILYMCHFVLPVAVAFILWMWRRNVFLEYMLSFLVIALAGFATYVLFPAAPPWIADRWFHQLPHVYRIWNITLGSLGGQSYSMFTHWVWDRAGWDLVAAMPSEHAALPFLAFLYVRRTWPRAGWVLIPYCVAIWFAVVYMGEHYVADVVAGVLYAAGGYALIQFLVRRRLVKSDPEPHPSTAMTDSLSA